MLNFIDKHQIHKTITQNVVEELTVVVVRFKSLFDGRPSLNPSIDVAVVQLLVEDQEWLVVIDQWRDFFRVRPRRRFEMFIGQFGKPK